MNYQLKPTRVGRGRIYPAGPLPGFASEEIGRLAADLAEFRERVTDQVEDLPDDALNYVAGGTPLTIGWVAMHLVATEAGWIATLSGRDVPDRIENDRNYRLRTPYGGAPSKFESAAGIVELMGTLFREFTLPVLQAIPDADRSVADRRLPTARDVIRHLNWHWVFHSGHIGIIRLQWGSEYEWTFAEDE